MAAATKRKSGGDWDLPPEHKGRVPRTHRPRYDVQAHNYTCGPIALRNAWTWQHAMTDNPLEPLPLTHSELIAKCGCTKEEGTDNYNLYTDFLKGEEIHMITPPYYKSVHLQLWLLEGNGLIVSHPTRTPFNHMVFAFLEKRHGERTWDYVVTNYHPICHTKRNTHTKMDWTRFEKEILCGWKEGVDVTAWLVPRHGRKPELVDKYVVDAIRYFDALLNSWPSSTRHSPPPLQAAASPSTPGSGTSSTLVPCAPPASPSSSVAHAPSASTAKPSPACPTTS